MIKKRYINISIQIPFLVERYDPTANKWFPVASMTTRRKHLGCAVYNGFICIDYSYLELIAIFLLLY